jgi:tripartite ATP-independent transporter DctP family solute receptor
MFHIRRLVVKKLLLCFLLLVMVVVTTSVVFAGGAKEDVVAEKSINLRVANFHAASQPYSLALKKWVEIVEQKTDGRIKGSVFSGGSVVTSQHDAYAQVKSGTVDATISLTVENDVPELQIIAFPYAFTTYEQWRKFVDGDEMKALEEEFLKKTGIRIIAKSYLGARHLTANKKVLSPLDLKGVKVRAIEMPLYIDMIESWGAKATPVALQELLQALSTGIVAGQENPIPSIYQNRLNEAQKYLMLTSHLVGGDFWMMNEKRFQSLSKEDQTILLDSAYEATAGYGDQLILEQEVELEETLKENGMIVIGPQEGLDVEAFVKLTREKLWPKYEDIIGKNLFDVISRL